MKHQKYCRTLSASTTQITTQLLKMKLPTLQLGVLVLHLLPRTLFAFGPAVSVRARVHDLATDRFSQNVPLSTWTHTSHLSMSDAMADGQEKNGGIFGKVS